MWMVRVEARFRDTIRVGVGNMTVKCSEYEGRKVISGM